jgi:hypothetical protein
MGASNSDAGSNISESRLDHAPPLTGYARPLLHDRHAAYFKNRVVPGQRVVGPDYTLSSRDGNNANRPPACTNLLEELSVAGQRSTLRRKCNDEPSRVCRVVLGLERRAPGQEIARHRHCGGYAALLLSGSYIEAREDGHFEVSAGNVVFHGPFHAHRDCIGDRGVVILNLALPRWFEPNIALGRVSNPDQIVTCAEKGAAQALSQIFEEAVPLVSEEIGWPHELSRAIHRVRVFPSLRGPSREAYRARSFREASRRFSECLRPAIGLRFAREEPGGRL